MKKQKLTFTLADDSDSDTLKHTPRTSGDLSISFEKSAEYQQYHEEIAPAMNEANTHTNESILKQEKLETI